MIQIDHVTFSYGEETEHTGGVRDIELQIKRGEFAVLCGESGCGKTTITRLINGLIPHYYEGKMSGGVWVNGAEVSKQPLYDTAKIVGSVFQNPRSQFFNVDTTSEITFGCENLGQPAETIRARLERTVCDFRLEKLMDRNIFHLSGGEKQKLPAPACRSWSRRYWYWMSHPPIWMRHPFPTCGKPWLSGKVKGKPSSYRNTGSIISAVWRIVLFI